jgi:HlyD family secretion protein
MTMTRASVQRRRVAVIAAPCMIVASLAGIVLSRRPSADSSLTAPVVQGTLDATLATNGVLRPVQSITYRSPLVGREAAIVELVPEGTQVAEGDLLIRLDTSEIETEIARVQQELRQIQMDLRLAETEHADAEGALNAVTHGEGLLTVEEARTRLQLAQKRAERLRHDYGVLKPLLDRGFLTSEELSNTENALDEAEKELALARKRAEVVEQMTHPREMQRAAVQVAQKQAQIEHARGREFDASSRLAQLHALAEHSRIHARAPGLVVYEEFLGASPRRKVRVGDRVGVTQGLITIPEVDRMLLEGSISEAEVHRVRPGQSAVIRLEAFPNLELTGAVERVGTLASASADRPIDDKRFDLTIAVDPTSAPLRPEMTARAEVTTARRDGVLLVPVNAVFQEHGAFVVHVPAGGRVETRRVVLGESNERLVEVTDGLRAGERVLLQLPAATTAATSAPTVTGEGSALQPH